MKSSAVSYGHLPAPGADLGWKAVLFVLVLQFWSRYLPSPWAVLVVDDWSNLAASVSLDSIMDCFWSGLRDPNRPLSSIAGTLAFRFFGFNAACWTLVSLIAKSLLVFAAMKMVMELSGRRRMAVLAGGMLALLPNLTETYHWSTQVLNEVFCALVPYALSGWMWVAYLRRGGTWRLLVSVLTYGAGIFSYEAGILLPAAYLTLIPWRRQPWKGVLRMVPFAMACLFYLAWRKTQAFGLIQTWQYPAHMQGGLSLRGLVINTWHLMHWWVGDYLFSSMLTGFQYFSAIPLWTKRFLFAGNWAIAFLMGWAAYRCPKDPVPDCRAERFTGRQLVLFGLVWTGAAWVISLVSYPVARLNVLPAMGISLLFALLLGRWPSRAWACLLVVPVVLGLAANQGTAECYRQAGGMNRAIYGHLQKNSAEWQTKQVILFDTRGLRERQTPGLLRPVNEDQAFWANCGNAPMARGFTFSGMVRLIAGTKGPAPRIVHDIEHGAKIRGDQLIWHERYDSSRPRTNAMADVFVVDCLAAGQDRL